jgi:glycerol-3-phosphate acyltransferase PlsX
VLGIAKPVIIGHGISKGKAFKNMILLAQQMIEKDMLGKLRTELIN